MTNTEAGLLDDIIANPADDVPRLIYADWLEEHGQEERAEFIRVQIELTQCPDPFDNRELSILYRAPAFLDFPGTKQDDFGWNGTGSTEIEYDSGAKTVFRRGFLAEIHGPMDTLREHLPRLVQEQPIEAVRVTDQRPYTEFSDVPAMWLRDFSDYPDVQQLALPDEHHIPPEVFDILAQQAAEESLGAFYFVIGKYGSTLHPTADAAHAALSAALLTWAKAHPLTRDVHLS